MITFNDIYEAAMNEKKTPEKLQKLPENFISEVAEYFNDKKEMSLKENDAFSDVVVKTKKQLENANTFFKELMNRRRKKILNLILIAAETGISKKDFDNMLDFEKELFENLMKCVENSDKKFNGFFNNNNNNNNSNEKKESEKQESNNGKEKIIFKEDVEEFAGLEGEKIGPFKKDDSAELQKEIAEILISAGKAELSN